jgi:hypothetical protein
LVKLKLPYSNPRIPAAIRTTAAILTAFISSSSPVESVRASRWAAR